MRSTSRRASLRKFLELVCLVACTSLLGACWRESDLVVQEEGTAYLRLLGDVTAVQLELDGNGARRQLSSEEQEEEDVVLLQVLPGRHLVELYRGGERIVRRDLYFALGQVVEMAVPQ